MVVGGLIEFLWEVNAERRSLEDVAGLRKCAESGLTGGLTSHVRRAPTLTAAGPTGPGGPRAR